ncbi:FAD/NAD-binding domain-containing protein, partial [Cristinia sonorae]
MSTGAQHILSVVEPEAQPELFGVDKIAKGPAEDAFTLGDWSIDEYRPIKVAVIGAGFSGILAGIRFRQYIPNVSLTIYDKNAGVGGTWYSNRYPGLACDIPSHSYQYTFEPWTDWSAYYAPGPEIRGYLNHVTDKYKLRPYLKLQHELVHARYDEPTAKWHIRVRHPKEGGDFEEFEDVVDVLFAGVGSLSRWKWPEVEGLQDYKGHLVHTAQWDTKDDEAWQDGVKDWKNKKVAVIGAGSSAIQVVPALQPYVDKLYNFVRGRTWICPTFGGQTRGKLSADGENCESPDHFTDEDKAKFKDPEYYHEFRHGLEVEVNSVHTATLKGSAMQNGAREAFTQVMKKRLEKKPWIADHIIPDFPVACRRLTPGPGYLEALCEDNVEFVPEGIKRFTEKGVETDTGRVEDFDVIVCCTGYDTSFQLPFPVIGRNGVALNDKWSPHPVTYLACCVDQFPNYFFSLGPNAAVGSGSLTAVIERQVSFAVQATQKLQRERLKSIEVKEEALKDFDEYLEHYFPTSVYSEKCRSWYKMGKEEGRVVGLWPGSCMHAIRALQYPRWEDFNYERVSKVKNRFQWLGDGSTHVEKYFDGEGAFYLTKPEIDYPPGT